MLSLNSPSQEACQAKGSAVQNHITQIEHQGNLSLDRYRMLFCFSSAAKYCSIRREWVRGTAKHSYCVKGADTMVMSRVLICYVLSSKSLKVGSKQNTPD